MLYSRVFMELSTIFRILFARKWILIIIPLVAAILAYFFSLNTQKKYRSSSILSTGFTTNEGIQITEERVDLWAAGVKFDNMIQKMNSEQVMALLSYQLMIHDLTDAKPFRTLSKSAGKKEVDIDPSQVNSMVLIFKSKLEKMEMLSSFDEKEGKLIGWMQRYGYNGWMLSKNLSIRRTGSTDFVEVSFVSENPQLSAFVVNKLSEEFIRFDSSIKSNNSSESVKFFAEIVDEKKKILDDKATFLEKFKTSNNLNGQDFTELKSTQLVSYEMLLQEKSDEIISKQIQLSNIEKQLSSSGGTSNDRETGEKIIQIRAKVNELNQIYVSTGSNDKQLEETINSLRSELQKEMNKLAVADPSQTNAKLSKDVLQAKKNQLELELQIAQNSLNSLDQTINNLKGSVYSSASKKSTIESLEKELERVNDEYLKAIERYNTEKNKSLLSQSSIKISQLGQPNGAPESSKRVLIVGMAGMASLGLCIFVIIGVEFIDQKLKTPAKFQAYCDLRLLGWINSIETKGLDLKSLFKSKSTDVATENFKQFLRKIRFEIESSNAKVLLVTSTKPSEGKTFIILSLAYSLSLLNKRTLIIDTNFRNNSLSRLLIAPASFQKMLQQDGNVKLLTSNVGVADESQQTDSNIISRTSDANIDIIGSSIGSESPSEILAGRDFKGMLVQLRSHYDYIFLEGASLNDFSDTKELLTYVDKVVTIFSANSALGSTDRESIDFIKSLNDTFLGAILNKVDMKNVA